MCHRRACCALTAALLSASRVWRKPPNLPGAHFMMLASQRNATQLFPRFVSVSHRLRCVHGQQRVVATRTGRMTAWQVPDGGLI